MNAAPLQTYRITFSNCPNSIRQNDPWDEDTGPFRLDIFLAEKFPVLRAHSIPEGFGPPPRSVPGRYEYAVDAWDAPLPAQIRWPSDWLAENEATELTNALLQPTTPPKLQVDAHTLVSELVSKLSDWLHEELTRLLPSTVRDRLQEYLREHWRSHVGQLPIEHDFLAEHFRLLPKVPSPVPMLSGSLELAIVQGAAPDGDPTYWSEQCHLIDRVGDTLVSETWGNDPTRDSKGWLCRDVHPCEWAIVSVHFRGATTLSNWLDNNGIYPKGMSAGSHWLLMKLASQRAADQWMSLTIPSGAVSHLCRHDHQHEVASRIYRIGAFLYADCYWHNEPPMLLNAQVIKAINKEAEGKLRPLPNPPNPNYRSGLPPELDRLPRVDHAALGYVPLRFDGPIDAWQISHELGELWFANRLAKTEELIQAHRTLVAIPEELLRHRFACQQWAPNGNKIDRAFCEWLEKVVNYPGVQTVQPEVYDKCIIPAFRRLVVSSALPAGEDFSEFLRSAVDQRNMTDPAYKFCAQMVSQLMENPSGRKYAQAIRHCRIMQDGHVILAVLLGKILFSARNALTHGMIQMVDPAGVTVTMANYEENQLFRISIDSLSRLYRLVVGFLYFLMSPR